MTNLYVTGYNSIKYSSIASSKTLVNADKVEASFIDIKADSKNNKNSLYLDENHNLYTDINKNTLIDTEVEEIFIMAYKKGPRFYVYNNNYTTYIDQVKEVLWANGEYVVFNNFNNQTIRQTYNSTAQIIYNRYFKAFCDNFYRAFGITDENILYMSNGNTYNNFSNTNTIADGFAGNVSFSQQYSNTALFIREGKVYALSSGPNGNTISTTPYLTFEEDEEVIKVLTNRSPVSTTFKHNYFIITNKGKKYTNINITSGSWDGVDPKYIINITDDKNTLGIAITSLVEFDINFYERDRETIATTIRSLPVVESNIIVNENQANITFKSAIDTYYNVVYNVEKIKGYGFAGFTTNKESLLIEIPVGTSDIVIDGLTNLYPIYVPALPDDAVVAVLYNMTCERNKIDKTEHLTRYLQIKGVFRSAVDVENPLLTLQLDAYPAFNYVYLPFFNRYYFVVGVRNISKNIYEINLKVDVLYTYKEQIKNCLAEIIRSSITEKQNPYIIDNLQPLKNTNIISAYEIPNTVFNNDNETWKNNFNYVLNVIRGLNLKSTHTFDVWQ